MSKYNEDIDWYCDNCKTYMNNQEGFNRNTGEWICSECGWQNNVTDLNIRPYVNVPSIIEISDNYDVLNELLDVGIDPFQDGFWDIPKKKKHGKTR